MSVSSIREIRSFRALLWGGWFFAFLQLGLGLASEKYSRLRDPLYGDKFARLRKKITDKPLVVMLGSSRTGFAFNGSHAEDVLDRRIVAFNFGTPGAGPIINQIYLRRMLASGVKPDLIVLEILPSLLALHPDPPTEKHWIFGHHLHRDEVERLLSYHLDPASLQWDWWQSVLLPWYTLRISLVTHLFPSALPDGVRQNWSQGSDPWGWSRRPNQTMTPAEKVRAVHETYLGYAPALANLEIGGPAVDALHDLLTLCREESIPVQLVLMPESTTFQTWYGPGVIDRIHGFLATLKVPVVDAGDWVPDDEFIDGHHLFVRGANRFTERLTREVIAPALRSEGKLK